MAGIWVDASTVSFWPEAVLDPERTRVRQWGSVYCPQKVGADSMPALEFSHTPAMIDAAFGIMHPRVCAMSVRD
jgi:hypothetical protein